MILALVTAVVPVAVAHTTISGKTLCGATTIAVLGSTAFWRDGAGRATPSILTLASAAICGISVSCGAVSIAIILGVAEQPCATVRATPS